MYIIYFIVPVFNNSDIHIHKMVCESPKAEHIYSANIRDDVQQNGFYWFIHDVSIVIIWVMLKYLYLLGR